MRLTVWLETNVTDTSTACPVNVKVNVRSGNFITGALSMARISLACHPRVSAFTHEYVAIVAFPAKAGIHLPTPERWMAELT